MSKLIVLRLEDHQEIEWDPAGVEAGEPEALATVEKAQDVMEEEQTKGGTAFLVGGPGQPAKRITDFDPTADQIVVLPSKLKTAAEEAGLEREGGEVLLAVANPSTARTLAEIASAIALGGKEMSLAALKIVPFPPQVPLPLAQRYVESKDSEEGVALRAVERYCAKAQVDVKTMLRAALGVATGIVAVAKNRPGTQLILMGWPGPRTFSSVSPSIGEKVLRDAPCDVGLFLNKGLEKIERLLVPVVDSPHESLALRLGRQITRSTKARMVVLRVVPSESEGEIEAEKTALEGVFSENSGALADRISLQVTADMAIPEAILSEAEEGYDLLVMGASRESFLPHWLFGAIPDIVAERSPCSVLMVKKHSAVESSWLRRITAWMQGAGEAD
ncbi:MAG: universal stress protein [Anaerolineales bacterium]